MPSPPVRSMSDAPVIRLDLNNAAASPELCSRASRGVGHTIGMQGREFAPGFGVASQLLSGADVCGKFEQVTLGIPGLIGF